MHDLANLTDEWQNLADLKRNSSNPLNCPNWMQNFVWNGQAEEKRVPLFGANGVSRGEHVFYRLCK